MLRAQLDGVDALVKVPRCVEVCPHDAIIFGEYDELVHAPNRESRDIKARV